MYLLTSCVCFKIDEGTRKKYLWCPASPSENRLNCSSPSEMYFPSSRSRTKKHTTQLGETRVLPVGRREGVVTGCHRCRKRQRATSRRCGAHRCVRKCIGRGKTEIRRRTEIRWKLLFVGVSQRTGRIRWITCRNHSGQRSVILFSKTCSASLGCFRRLIRIYTGEQSALTFDIWNADLVPARGNLWCSSSSSSCRFADLRSL